VDDCEQVISPCRRAEHHPPPAVVPVIPERPNGDEHDGLDQHADGHHGEEKRRGVDAAGV
jgi:hypothetical protein